MSCLSPQRSYSRLPFMTIFFIHVACYFFRFIESMHDLCEVSCQIYFLNLPTPLLRPIARKFKCKWPRANVNRPKSFCLHAASIDGVPFMPILSIFLFVFAKQFYLLEIQAARHLRKCFWSQSFLKKTNRIKDLPPCA